MSDLNIGLVYDLNGLLHRSPWLDGIILAAASPLAYVLVAAFLLYAFFLPAAYGGRWSFLAVGVVSGVVARLVVTPLIWHVYDHPRPLATLKLTQIVAVHGASFPSGHASLLFALAVTALLYDRRFGIMLVVGASIVSLARIAIGAHYPSDILGGLAVGAACAMGTYFAAEALRRARAQRKVSA